MKYVVFDKIFPVLFTDCLYHAEVTCAHKPTSAGYFSVSNGKVHTWGESTGMNLKPSPNDAMLIEIVLKK